MVHFDPAQEKFRHPKLSPEEDARQRGTTPEPQIEHRDPQELPPVDPKRRREVEAHVREWMHEKGRNRQDGLWPYLLIRAVLGDHGVRPIPSSAAFWESPDILVVPGDVPTLEGQTPTLNPTAGAPHTVFVHAWNIGKLASFGTRLTVYWANPSFAFDPPHVHTIGATFIDLPDRLSPDCHRPVRIPQLWTPVVENAGHECLLARLESFTDGAGPGLDARLNRHIGQRNLQLATPQFDLSALLQRLSIALPLRAELHLLHGMKQLDPILLTHRPDLSTRLVAPARAPKQGVTLARGDVHLGAAVLADANTVHLVPAHAIPPQRNGEIDRATLLHSEVSSMKVSAAFRQGVPEADSVKGASRTPKATPRPERPQRVNFAAEILRKAGIYDLRAGNIAAALGGEKNTAHVLRFEARQDGIVIGGYTVIVTQTEM